MKLMIGKYKSTALNLLFPGFGYYINGRYVEFAIIQSLIFVLFGIGDLLIISEKGNSFYGYCFFAAIAGVWIISALLYLLLFGVKDEADKKYVPLIISTIIPGSGYLFFGKVISFGGVIYFILSIAKIKNEMLSQMLIFLLKVYVLVDIYNLILQKKESLNNSENKGSDKNNYKKILLIGMILNLLIFLLPPIINKYFFQTITVMLKTDSIETTSKAKKETALLKEEQGNVYTNYRRGDIVRINFGKYKFVKKIAAIEGDLVEIENDIIKINGKEYGKGYESIYNVKYGLKKTDYTVPKNTVFIIGDKTDVSYDSRHFGPVPKIAVDGKVYKIVWPLK